MAVVIVDDELKARIKAAFKAESRRIFRRMLELEARPQQGKAVGHVGRIVIKELKYGKYRFYFVTDGHAVKFHSAEALAGLLIRFVRMSDKKEQQKVIEEIKAVLRSLGEEGF